MKILLAVALTFVLLCPGCGINGAPASGSPTRNSRIRELAMASRGKTPDELKAEKGREVYQKRCQVCHGKKGDGKGFNAFNIKEVYGLSPRDFTSPMFFSRVKESRLQQTIREGGPSVGLSPAMPPWGNTLSEEDIRNVILYLRRLNQPAP